MRLGANRYTRGHHGKVNVLMKLGGKWAPGISVRPKLIHQSHVEDTLRRCFQQKGADGTLNHVVKIIPVTPALQIPHEQSSVQPNKSALAWEYDDKCALLNFEGEPLGKHFLGIRMRGAVAQLDSLGCKVCAMTILRRSAASLNKDSCLNAMCPAGADQGEFEALVKHRHAQYTASKSSNVQKREQYVDKRSTPELKYVARIALQRQRAVIDPTYHEPQLDIVRFDDLNCRRCGFHRRHDKINEFLETKTCKPNGQSQSRSQSSPAPKMTSQPLIAKRPAASVGRNRKT